MEWLKDILDYTLFTLNEFEFKVIRIFYFFLILVLARMFSYFVIGRIMPRYYTLANVDYGRRYATNQIIKYFVYTIALLSSVQSLGINLTVIWGAVAALAVGFGLGVQQTFNDLASGIILLLERTVEAGDLLDIDGTLGRVTHIGMRTCKVESLDGVSLIIPNSIIVGNKITNWSHNHDQVRFSVKVGVAYGTDTALVKKILLDVAQQQPNVMDDPAPFVRFNEFADSALVFELFFWSLQYQAFLDTKSEIRFAIDSMFRENGIVIPFPQRDLWIKAREGASNAE